MYSKPTTEDHVWARRAQQAQVAMHQLALMGDDAKLAAALASIQTCHCTLHCNLPTGYYSHTLSAVQLKARAAAHGCRLEVRS